MKLTTCMLASALILFSSGHAFAQSDQAGPAAVTQEHGLDEQAMTEEDAPKFCPVCGPHDEMEELGFLYKHAGKRYRFCSLDCMKTFKKDPEKYITMIAEEGHAEAGHGHGHHSTR